MEQYILEVEAERVKIRKVLFGKSRSTNKSLFPLYDDINFDTENASLLNQLRQIMKPFDKSINDKNQAIDFVNKIYAFNEKYSAATKKTSDSTSDSIISSDSYYEDTGSPIDNESTTERQEISA
jgi:hypothetical protein